MKSKRVKNPAGETFESLMQDLGIRDEVYETATKRVLAWQLEQVRKANGLTKRAMAEAMRTSRSHLDRVLDPNNVEVSLATLERAARALGKRLKVELVDAA
ncbi:MAG: XRE family transcriptional regulator [Proteobacteria bacterium]|nr:XRE family transcriptional regulator [Pseudomonadota bacterium]